MSEIELVDKKSFSSEELISESKSVKKTSQKKKNFKPILFTIFTFLVILSLIACFFHITSTSYPYSKNSTHSPTFEKGDPPKKLEERKIIPYETPNKVEGLLDYILYPYHSEIIRNLDDYEFIRDSLGKISLKMVFNSDFHGDYAMDVHSRANYHHILVLIETEKGNRFGGYTSDNFTPQTFGLTSTSIELFKKDNSAFLFNLDAKKIYNIKPEEALKALDCDDYFTLCFGEGDLVLRDKYLTSGGISNFPEYYGDENTKKNVEQTNEELIQMDEFEEDEELIIPDKKDKPIIEEEPKKEKEKEKELTPEEDRQKRLEEKKKKLEEKKNEIKKIYFI